MSGEMWYTNGTKYDADNRVTEVKYDDSDTHKVNLTYDLLNRITNKTVTNGVSYSTNYTYVAGDTASYGANATTPLIETITQGSGANAMNFAYTYDNRGNIVSEVRNGVTVSYEYDELGQLIRVNDPNDKTAGTSGTTWVYTYDRGGNILNKSAYGYTTSAVSSPVNQWSYAYEDANWKDKLTKFNGVSITYDAIGNPLSDGTWTYTWGKGRQLKSMNNASTGVTLEFKYNHNGIRTQKVKKVDGTVTETTDYILKGKYVIAMKKNTVTYYFNYDASGKPVTINLNGSNYTYVKNLQGDIVGILDASGNLVVEYKYGVWGTPISISSLNSACDLLTFDNPFRYRGYIWDEETGLYYLRSRFYKPEWSRFVNADSKGGYIAGLISHNVYSYCMNVPLMMVDSNGQDSSIVTSFNAVKESKDLTEFLDLVDLIAQMPYSMRGGKVTEFQIAEKYISEEEADGQEAFLEGIVKMGERGLTLITGFSIGGTIGTMVGKLTSAAPFIVGTVATQVSQWVVEDIEDKIKGSIIDSFSSLQGSYTSMQVKVQYNSHRHFIFFSCDCDWVTYEIRNYDNSYFELWSKRNSCSYSSLVSQKIASIDIND